MNIINLDYFRAKKGLCVGPVLVLVSDPESCVLKELQLPWPIIPITQPAVLLRQEIEPDFFLLDVSVSWCDPCEVTRALSRQTPFVWLTTKPHQKKPHWIKKAYEAGVSDVFCSPFDATEICEALTVLLRLKHTS